MKIFDRYAWLALAVSLLMTVAARAWDYEGHRTVNQLALAALPPDFPAFVRESANAERVAFLSGEPDRWRNTTDLPIKHFNGVDHYCNLEQLTDAGLTPATVSALRYEFALQFAAGRAAHAANFPALDPTKNSDRTREWPGFAPWAIAEYYGKLKSAFSYWNAFREAGTPEEIANAQPTLFMSWELWGITSGTVRSRCTPPSTIMAGWEKILRVTRSGRAYIVGLMAVLLAELGLNLPISCRA